MLTLEERYPTIEDVTNRIRTLEIISNGYLNLPEFHYEQIEINQEIIELEVLLFHYRNPEILLNKMRLERLAKRVNNKLDQVFDYTKQVVQTLRCYKYCKGLANISDMIALMDNYNSDCCDYLGEIYDIQYYIYPIRKLETINKYENKLTSIENELEKMYSNLNNIEQMMVLNFVSECRNKIEIMV